MNMIFASDLDNTLIHSYKFRKEDDVCVEWIQDKEQSFMSKKAIENVDKEIDIPEKANITAIKDRVSNKSTIKTETSIDRRREEIRTHLKELLTFCLKKDQKNFLKRLKEK